MESPKFISTATLAARFDRVPASIRTALWRHGHWNGLKPVRLPNGMLLWNAAEVEALSSGERSK